jgi:hypothetical protein
MTKMSGKEESRALLDKSEEKNQKTTKAVDFLFFKRLLVLLRILYRKPAVAVATLLLALLLTVQTYLISFTGKIIGGVYTAVGESNLGDFKTIVMYGIFLELGAAIMDALVKFLAEIIYLSSRKYLYQYMNHQYFTNMIFYKVNDSQCLDNP